MMTEQIAVQLRALCIYLTFMYNFFTSSASAFGTRQREKSIIFSTGSGKRRWSRIRLHSHIHVLKKKTKQQWPKVGVFVFFFRRNRSKQPPPSRRLLCDRCFGLSTTIERHLGRLLWSTIDDERVWWGYVFTVTRWLTDWLTGMCVSVTFWLSFVSLCECCSNAAECPLLSFVVVFLCLLFRVREDLALYTGARPPCTDTYTLYLLYRL